LSQYTRVTDGQIDGQTDRILIAIPRLHYMSAVKITKSLSEVQLWGWPTVTIHVSLLVSRYLLVCGLLLTSAVSQMLPLSLFRRKVTNEPSAAERSFSCCQQRIFCLQLNYYVVLFRLLSTEATACAPLKLALLCCALCNFVVSVINKLIFIFININSSKSLRI